MALLFWGLHRKAQVSTYDWLVSQLSMSCQFIAPPVLYLTSGSHTLNTCRLAFSQRLKETPMQISRVLCITPSSLYPAHKFHSLLSLKTLISLLVQQYYHTLLEFSFPEPWSRKYFWKKAGGGGEADYRICFVSLVLVVSVRRITPVPVPPTRLEVKFSPPLFCLIISCSLLMFSVPSFI